MPNAFGFSIPGQQPSPDPRAVGAQLAQPQQQQRSPPGLAFDDPLDFEAPARSREAALRREGGKLMGSGGPDADGAFAAAVGEKLTRAGGGHRGNPNPHKDLDGHVRQIIQLGVSPFEAELLRETL